MSVHKKLQQARVMLQGKQLKKTGHNKFAGYNYFELGDFLPVVNEIFGGLGLCAVISYGRDLATMTIRDTDDGEEITITSPMAEANLKGCHPIQNLGAVETYTRRYLYVTALEIVEHDAIDAAEPVNPSGTKKGTGVHKPSDGAMESLSAQRQRVIADLAVLVNDAMQISAEDAFIVIDEAELDHDEKVALWSLLDSKTRSAIKKVTEARKAELVSQP